MWVGRQYQIPFTRQCLVYYRHLGLKLQALDSAAFSIKNIEELDARIKVEFGYIVEINSSKVLNRWCCHLLRIHISILRLLILVTSHYEVQKKFILITLDYEPLML